MEKLGKFHIVTKFSNYKLIQLFLFNNDDNIYFCIGRDQMVLGCLSAQ